MKRIFAFVIGLIYFGTAQSQNANALPETGIKAAYMGSIIYPGFKIGIERPSKII